MSVADLLAQAVSTPATPAPNDPSTDTEAEIRKQVAEPTRARFDLQAGLTGGPDQPDPAEEAREAEAKRARLEAVKQPFEDPTHKANLAKIAAQEARDAEVSRLADLGRQLETSAYVEGWEEILDEQSLIHDLYSDDPYEAQTAMATIAADLAEISRDNPSAFGAAIELLQRDPEEDGYGLEPELVAELVRGSQQLRAFEDQQRHQQAAQAEWDGHLKTMAGLTEARFAQVGERFRHAVVRTGGSTAEAERLWGAGLPEQPRMVHELHDQGILTESDLDEAKLISRTLPATHVAAALLVKDWEGHQKRPSLGVGLMDGHSNGLTTREALDRGQQVLQEAKNRPYEPNLEKIWRQALAIVDGKTVDPARESAASIRSTIGAFAKDTERGALLSGDARKGNGKRVALADGYAPGIEDRWSAHDRKKTAEANSRVAGSRIGILGPGR